MASEPVAPRASRGRFLVSTVVALLCLALGLAIGTRPDAPAPSASQEVLRPTPDVITAVRDLARLETVRFHMERVVDLRDRQEVLFGLTQAEDAILLVAAGDVVAGVDLSRISESDVVVDAERHHVRITLPPPEVLSARLDEERTFVYSRETDVLARRSETLETRARRHAESSIASSAIEAGILDRAGRNAELSVGSLVRALGFTHVEIRYATDESLPRIAPGPARPLLPRRTDAPR